MLTVRCRSPISSRVTRLSAYNFPVVDPAVVIQCANFPICPSLRYIYTIEEKRKEGLLCAKNCTNCTKSTSWKNQARIKKTHVVATLQTLLPITIRFVLLELNFSFFMVCAHNNRIGLPYSQLTFKTQIYIGLRSLNSLELV